MKRNIIGIAIGGTKTSVTFADYTNGSLNIHNKEVFTSFPDNDARSIEQIYNIIDYSSFKPDFISIISGGPLDSSKGTINNPPHLPGFKNTPIVSLFKQKYKCDVTLINDADACALAEYYYGAGKGSTNMAFCTFGTGFGSGLILNHKLYKGNNGMAGEIGHIKITDDGPIGYGVAGSVEGWCAGGNIYKWSNISGIKNTKELFDLANSGNSEALKAIDTITDRLAQSISILIDTLNLDTIVIGGIYPRNLKLLETPLKEAVKKYALKVNNDVCNILPSKLGEHIDDYSSLMGIMEEKDMMTIFEKYPELEQQRTNIESVIKILTYCYKNNGKILVCGNGGSAADASHIVGELMKGFMDKRKLDNEQLDKISKEFNDENIANKFQKGIPCIDLGAQAGLITAFANDVDPDLIFAQQVIGYSSNNSNDVLIGLSTSGNSKNVVNAIKVGKAIGIKTIALTGAMDSKMSESATVTIKAPATETYLTQEYHLSIYHYICQKVEEFLFLK